MSNFAKYSPNLGLVAMHQRTLRNGAQYEKFFTGTKQGTDPLLSKDASVYDTLDLMQQVVKSYSHQVAALARHLQGNTRKETCRNIYDFLYNHIQYKLDKAGEEQIRTPLRSWADRKTGIDCDCYSVFAACLLKELNIPFAFRIIKLNGKQDFQHVYVVVPLAGNTISAQRSSFIVIDPVLDKFDTEAPGITQKHDKVMAGIGIPVRLLNGLDAAVPTNSNTFTTELNPSQLVSATNSTAMAINAGAGDLMEPVQWSASEPKRKEQMADKLYTFFKVYKNALIAEGAHLRKDYNLVTYVDIILSNWNNPKKRYAAWLLYLDADQKVRKAQWEAAHERKTFFQKIGNALGDLAKIPGQVFDWAKDKVDDVWHFIKQVGLFVPRQLMRAAIALNVLDSGRKLKPGIYTWAQAQTKGYTLAQWQANQAATRRVEKRWEQMGGNVGDLRAAIGQGAAPSGIKLGGLGGELVTDTAAATAGTGLVSTIIIPELKDVVISTADDELKKIAADATKGAIKKASDAVSTNKGDSSTPSTTTPGNSTWQPNATEPNKANKPAEPATNNNTILLVGSAALFLLAIAVLK